MAGGTARPEGLATPEVVILDMTRLVQLDTTGLEGLENLRDKLQKRGCTLLVCGLNSQPGSLLRRSGFLGMSATTTLRRISRRHSNVPTCCCPT